ncbi:hypothetical protein ANAPRD1_01352 [Anaplasma phagocytophilum]|uniref:hypothetical protein n=1 Tax=Anaplasma phagocytophilum TaxID=948 RepID=UPI0007E10028|nr:hypothetical protein [Anaplasma phagocytophilum]SCV66835.1 hypothetical protein ANAPRD1_01352 [Anaplasma phagocytophilum]
MRERLLEYITELKTQIVFVLKKELEALSVCDIQRFKALQDIEGKLLLLLSKASKKVKKDATIVRDGDYNTVEKLTTVCIEFDRCLAMKHDALSSLQNSAAGVLLNE